ncbi:hypothetical protein [Brevibacillus dissolubilis]|uniref:hypothetical protein n=1 Tax=Brevibacillus dissolubilis TaxID=1844116 RepID=UPI0011163F1E|nr:hypothetical protein [Brevibacillus dissolubilis]
MKRTLCLLLSFCLLFITAAPTSAHYKRWTVSVHASPSSAFVSTLTIESKDNLAKHILKAHRLKSSLQPELPRATIQIDNRTFVFDSYSHLFEPAAHSLIGLSQSQTSSLEEYVRIAEKAHYGQPLHWQDVRQTFKRYGYATVVDLETGKQFRVQRRAGSQHADVQPLTKEDTQIMKEIYQGEWSWKRRAILVYSEGKTFAASMHGMPHGKGAIAGNNFNGHFCIHFTGSSTHKRPIPDPSHSMMILKAAGKLKHTLIHAKPAELVQYFLTAMHEQDYETLAMTMDGATLPFAKERILYVKPSKQAQQEGVVDLVTAVIPMEVELIEKGDKRRKHSTWVFFLKRNSPFDRWKIAGLTRDGDRDQNDSDTDDDEADVDSSDSASDDS